MSFTITVLGSGSKGNAFVFGAGGLNIMVDAGFSRKEIIRRLELREIDPTSIQAVLITHEHDDHVKGAKVFCNTFNIPLCIASRTADYLRKKEKLPNKVVLFSPGDAFKIAGYEVKSFPVWHDAVEPVGFVISHGEHRIGIATDLGAVNALVEQQLHDCSALLLETNYDMELLRLSERSYNLKRRIMGNNGHLHNVDTMTALPKLITSRTKKLILTHISQECNSYSIVEELTEQLLSDLNRHDIEWMVAKQDIPLPHIKLASSDCSDLLEWANCQ